MSASKILKLCKWSEPKEVQTERGPKMFRTAESTEAFWIAWRADREALKRAGVRWHRSEDETRWTLQFWQPLPKQPEPEKPTKKRHWTMFDMIPLMFPQPIGRKV